MDKELTPQEFTAIKEFADGLRGCFESKKKTKEEFTEIFMNYAIQVIDIHLSLSEIKVDRFLHNLEMAVRK